MDTPFTPAEKDARIAKLEDDLAVARSIISTLKIPYGTPLSTKAMNALRAVWAYRTGGGLSIFAVLVSSWLAYREAYPVAPGSTRAETGELIEDVVSKIPLIVREVPVVPAKDEGKGIAPITLPPGTVKVGVGP